MGEEWNLALNNVFEKLEDLAKRLEAVETGHFG
jgi:hypothetical protein